MDTGVGFCGLRGMRQWWPLGLFGRGAIEKAPLAVYAANLLILEQMHFLLE